MTAIPTVINNIILSKRNDDHVISLGMEIMGEPLVQNGWKVRWRGLRFPIVYDPRKKEKAQVRAAILATFMNVFAEQSYPLMGSDLARPLRMIADYHLYNATTKDLDNMSNFLLDLLQKVVYVDDKQIFELVLKKNNSIEPKTVIYIEEK